MRFSDHYGLGKSQSELDFVDIPLDTDIRVFVDPYSFNVESDVWFKECGRLVKSFFQKVIDHIANGQDRKAKKLLAHLGEANDTHLGYTKGSGGPAGRGIGRNQARYIFRALKNSQAAQSGSISDISECELYIDGIGPDKISDMTINIIRNQLIEYTQTQCATFGIPTRETASGMYWNGAQQRWENRYVDLPVYDSSRIILIPKAAVRLRMAFDHDYYYRMYILEYLQAEHRKPGDALATVLKNKKIRVYKKDLKEKYPKSKDFIFSFSHKHPEVLDQYKSDMKAVARHTPSNEEIEGKQTDPRKLSPQSIVDRLESTDAGKADADEYHNIAMSALETVFAPTLYNPVKEQHQHKGRKRVDITYNNRADTGFFRDLSTTHQIKCPYIFFECKNYSGKLKNPDFDQLTGRFGTDKGNFGVLLCRSVDNRKSVIDRCKDAMRDGRGYVIVLDDNDIKQLLNHSSNGEREQIQQYMDDRFREVIM